MDKKELLKDQRVVEEIQRHLWIESEKVGHDIGFDKASQDWLEKFSKAWMEYNVPKKKTSTAAKIISKITSGATRAPKTKK